MVVGSPVLDLSAEVRMIDESGEAANACDTHSSVRARMVVVSELANKGLLRSGLLFKNEKITL